MTTGSKGESLWVALSPTKLSADFELVRSNPSGRFSDIYAYSRLNEKKVQRRPSQAGSGHVQPVRVGQARGASGCESIRPDATGSNIIFNLPKKSFGLIQPAGDFGAEPGGVRAHSLFFQSQLNYAR